MSIAVSTILMIVFGAVAAWSFFTVPGIKPKAHVLAIFLGGVFLAATTFGIWIKATTTDMTGKTLTTVDQTIK